MNQEPPQTCSAAGCQDFQLFWNVYPRRESKKQAIAAFKKLNGPISSILAAVAATEFSPDLKFIPLPATWLNRGLALGEKVRSEK